MPDTEQIGSFTFSVAFAEPQPDSPDSADQRSETLAAWLHAQWQRQHQQPEEVQHAERN